MSRRFDLNHPEVAHLLRFVQDGVVSRRQLEAYGASPCDIARMVRRRDLSRIHPGVFVNHTGRLIRQQREWGAVLALWPAALSHESALPDPPTAVVHVAVDLSRRVQAPECVIVHRTAHLDARVDWRRSPPSVWLDDALLDVMSTHLTDGDVPAAFGALTRATYTRRTNPDRILAALARRRRIPQRATLEALVSDVRDGACSVLERGYLHRVERAHGLPRGVRQHRSQATGRPTDQDVRYYDYDIVVELDGRAYHDSPQARDRDAVRDLAELATRDAVTARVTYAMVYGDQCRTAAWIATLLQRRGWRGSLSHCPSCAPRWSP